MFDPKCYDLAVMFLEDHQITAEATREALAQHIQTSIEDFIWALENAELVRAHTRKE